MTVLEELIKNNEFPIIFIGAGISKRYLENYPGWLDLLEKTWKEVEEKDFYSELNIISEDIETTNEREKDFYTNTKIATILEKKIENKFNKKELEIEGLTLKEKYLSKINPFKKYLANVFSHYNVIQEKKEEITEFQNMLKKARIILTTNYDTFIEDTFNEKDKKVLKKYIGQKGLFRSESRYCELYKIHGCVSDSNTIVITEKDYEQYNKNSILITSKIVSNLLHSPIIFLGYSLTDLNVRNILKNFAEALDSNEKNEFSKKIIIINWDENEENFREEQKTDDTLNCTYTVISTNNYLGLYKKISEINQGITPAEISKFEHIIKELIISKGRKGELDKTLVTLVSKRELDGALKDLENKNLAIALGDRAIFAKTPSIIDYLDDYISENDDTDISSQLRYIAQLSVGTLLPGYRYLKNFKTNEHLLENEKKNLQKRFDKLISFNKENSISTYKRKYEYKTIKEILEIINKTSIKLKNPREYKYAIINHNIDNFSKEDLKNYLLSEIDEMRKNNDGTIITHFRKLLINYDLKYNKGDRNSEKK
ncbi:SIR2 family protein [Fusobacterium perfoetens]|uniref:SIR2 family protein n=1 Tax=Fusobacterium perfoetens TaxID=852 RepID=UPI0026EA94C1|nr:SIR2 family protein [Fusobacterium perfoetens]